MGWGLDVQRGPGEGGPSTYNTTPTSRALLFFLDAHPTVRFGAEDGIGRFGDTPQVLPPAAALRYWFVPGVEARKDGLRGYSFATDGAPVADMLNGRRWR